MPYRKLTYRQDKLRNCRLLLDLARVFNDAIYGEKRLGTSLDGVFITACVALGHAEGRVMNVSKLAHYLGMSRQTVSRRLDELIELGVVERMGQYYFVSQTHSDLIDGTHLVRANNLVRSACRELAGAE